MTTFNEIQISEILSRFRDSETSEIQTECLVHLKELTEYLKNDGNRTEVSKSTLTAVVNFLEHCSQLLSTSAFVGGQTLICLVTECFRSLRNACAGCVQNQDHLGRDGEAVNITCDVLKKLLKPKSELAQGIEEETKVIAVRCGVQLLGNMVSGHPDNQHLVWKSFFLEFRNIMTYPDVKVFNYVCMVIRNCLSEERLHEMITSDNGQKMLKNILVSLMIQDAEWGLFIIEDIICKADIAVLYKELTYEERNALLQIMSANIENFQAGQKSQLKPLQTNLVYLCEELVKDAHCVLGLGTHFEDKVEPVIVLKILEVLCTATGIHGCYQDVTQNIELLKCCVNLLASIHTIGMEGENNFTSIPKLDSAADDSFHPVFGLKCNLIRLIGNMCYENRSNQDKVRELGGIPLLLDHTNIDKKNPFIPQWSIFALRNLCQDNQENKAVIAGLKMEGLANNAEVLRQCGVQVELRGDKIHVKPSEPS